VFAVLKGIGVAPVFGRQAPVIAAVTVAKLAYHVVLGIEATATILTAIVTVDAFPAAPLA
jgi:hypothetical protein